MTPMELMESGRSKLLIGEALYYAVKYIDGRSECPSEKFSGHLSHL